MIICIFALVIVKTKRKIASIVLLAVMLPMLLLSSLHIHPLQPSAAGEECADCVQHHCGGHIGQQVLTIHDCVLCQFLSLQMLAAAMTDVTTNNYVCTRCHAQCQPALLTQVLGNIVMRGPPAA